MKRRELLGIIISIIYCVGAVIFFVYIYEDTTPKKLSLADISNYVASIVGGLALFWIIIGYFQQGEELNQNTLALISQKEVMSRQIKENNKITISNSYQQLTSTYNNFIMDMAGNERLAKVWGTGKNNLEKLDDIDLESFYLLCIVYLGHHENLFILQEYDSLPDELLIAWNKNLKANMRSVGFQRYWEFEGEHYYPKFKILVDSMVDHSEGNGVRHNFKDFLKKKNIIKRTPS